MQKLSRKPHDLIVQPITSWYRYGQLNMLFPLAKTNLRRFMGGTPPPIFEKSTISWILKQFLGLASAVEHIHQMSSIDLQDHSLSSPVTLLRYHGNIVPENILLFDSGDQRSPILKLGNFACMQLAKYSNNRRHNTSKPRDIVQDFRTETLASEMRFRSVDIRALGCVFSEMLLWMFNQKQPGLFPLPDALLSRGTGRFDEAHYRDRILHYRVLCRLDTIRNLSIAQDSTEGKTLVALIRIIETIFDDVYKSPDASKLTSQLETLYKNPSLEDDPTSLDVNLKKGSIVQSQSPTDSKAAFGKKAADSDVPLSKTQGFYPRHHRLSRA